jgi:hypothetical protein
MEIINHLLGTCGESHPNLITTSLLLLAITFFVSSKVVKTYKK